MSPISGNGFGAIQVDAWLDFVVKHNDLKHYVSLVERPGNLALMGVVEYSLFPPATKANEKFHVHIVEWKEKAWNIFSLPRERHDDVIRTAKALALSIAPGPPTILSFGANIEMLLAVRPTRSEAEIKTHLVRIGLPQELVKRYSGLETFPTEVKVTHAVENDQRLLRQPLKPEEHAEIRQRELAICDAMSHGIRPSPKEVADYVYGSGRVLTSRPA